MEGKSDPKSVPGGILQHRRPSRSLSQNNSGRQNLDRKDRHRPKTEGGKYEYVVPGKARAVEEEEETTTDREMEKERETRRQAGGKRSAEDEERKEKEKKARQLLFYLSRPLCFQILLRRIPTRRHSLPSWRAARGRSSD